MGSKVLVVGIDAMDPRIYESMRDELPNFSKLNLAQLQTTIPPETPVAWSAASTGCNPGRYGIYDFINRDPETYMPKLNLAEEKAGMRGTEYVCAMKGTPFWRILNREGISTTMIRWPVTFPAQEVRGRMLSGLGVVDLKGMLNSYSFYTDDVTELKKEGREKVVMVEVDDREVETTLAGPLKNKGGKVVPVEVPMKVEVGEDEVEIEVGGNETTLRKGEWSDILRVKFKTGMLSHLYGIVDFYLVSIKPHLKLYASSVQIDPENQVVKITHPDDYGSELVSDIGLFYTLGMPEETKAVTEEKIGEGAMLERVKKLERIRNRMFFHEFERFEDGLYAFVFDAGDRLKHVFWNNMDMRKEFRVPDAVADYYREKDAFLGKVLSELDSDTRLIVLSDHGFNNFEHQFNLNSWLVENGYMNVCSRKGTLFDFVDWSNTQAYSLGFTSLYINVEGREGSGIVEKEDVQALVDEIATKLAKVKHKAKQVFTSVYKGAEVYKGDYAHLAPDIVVGFSPGYRMSWKSAIGALDEDVISENTKKWSGDHLIDRSHVPGVLFTNFEINKQNPEIIDVAPTILKLFGASIPDEMDGEALV